MSVVQNRANTVGEWLSLVEHSVRDAGVGGSNPLFPTTLNNRNFSFLWLENLLFFASCASTSEKSTRSLIYFSTYCLSTHWLFFLLAFYRENARCLYCLDRCFNHFNIYSQLLLSLSVEKSGGRKWSHLRHPGDDYSDTDSVCLSGKKAAHY